MKHVFVVVAVLALALAGCSTIRPNAAPGCSGPRRPANPNGAVLGAAATPPPAAAATAGQCMGGAR